MSLAPGEQRTLTEIENQLRRSDPRLAAMFVLFSTQSFHRRGPVRKLLALMGPERGRAIRVIVLAVVAASLAAFLAVGIFLACQAGPAHVGPAHGGQVPGSGMLPFPRLGPGPSPVPGLEGGSQIPGAITMIYGQWADLSGPAPLTVTLSIRPLARCRGLALAGEADFTSQHALRDAIGAAFDCAAGAFGGAAGAFGGAADDVHLELAALRFIDVCCVRVLVTACGEQRDTHVTLHHPPRPLLRIMTLTWPDTGFDIAMSGPVLASCPDSAAGARTGGHVTGLCAAVRVANMS